MQSVVRSIFVLFLLGFFTVAPAQLPPKVIADKYRIQVGQLLKKEDYKAAFNMVEKIIVLQKERSLTLSHEFYFKDTIEQLFEEKRYITLLKIMDKILVLQKEHSLTLPNEFHFQYAQVAFSTGLFQTAVDAAKKYLATSGKKGTFYKEALALLNKAEEAEQIIPIEPEMVVIPSGHFLMEDVRGVMRSVNIDLFALSKYEVTFEEYDVFTDATGRERHWLHNKDKGRDRYPVTWVSWEDAVAYTHWLSSQTGKSYRLPSEEEWEYASRAGSTEEYGWFRDDIRVNGANCYFFALKNQLRRTTAPGTYIAYKAVPVGSFRANKWGLHDMICNVSEWMQDDWDEDWHTACGGSWVDDPFSVFWTPCLSRSSDYRDFITGFRIARSF